MAEADNPSDIVQADTPEIAVTVPVTLTIPIAPISENIDSIDYGAEIKDYGSQSIIPKITPQGEI